MWSSGIVPTPRIVAQGGAFYVATTNTYSGTVTTTGCVFTNNQAVRATTPLEQSNYITNCVPLPFRVISHASHPYLHPDIAAQQHHCSLVASDYAAVRPMPSSGADN